MVIELITTSSDGRSNRSVEVRSIPSTTSRDAWSATSPKMVCLKVRCGCGPTVMKNCEPLVPGPALAMASRYGLLNASSGWNSSANV